MFLSGCQSDACEDGFVMAFTHYGHEQLAIYKSANGDVLKYIKPDEEGGWITRVVRSRGNYLKVSFEDFKLDGWVKKGSLSLNTRNYDGRKIFVYKKPDKYSEQVSYLLGEQTVTVWDACGQWAYIEGKGSSGKVFGWLEPEMQCGNPYTTCP